MVVVSLTRHFTKRWGERCGFIPTIEEINQTIGAATKIQTQMLVYRLRHGEYRAFKILAAYWHHPSGVIIKVDEESKSAVTVMTAGHGTIKVQKEGRHVWPDGEG